MDGVAISIIGRPRPLPGHDTPNAAHNTYTLKCEEPVYMGSTGEVSMGREIASFGLSVSTDTDRSDPLGRADGLHRGDSATIEGVGTFTLKEAHSDIVWFTPNPGKATFCFDPDPTFTMNNFAQQGH